MEVFSKKFPIHRKLISINKVHTGNENKDFNLRHDWNSLLSDNDELLFKNYSKDYFPHADTYVNYLKDYYTKNELNVLFNQKVININQNTDLSNNNIFIINTTYETYITKKLIVSTGTIKENEINFPYIINYSELSLDKEQFINKKILIVGGGNSGYEVANYLTDTAANITIITKNPVRFAWQTHYVGDLRAVNNEFLDTYQLKSQNVLFEDDIHKYLRKMAYDSVNKKFIMKFKESINNYEFDYIINCTGFRFDSSIFSFPLLIKYNLPVCKPNYESVDIPNLFFTGRLMHYQDYKKSSGAFIHGFRYLIRSFVNIETNNLKQINLSYYELNSKIIDRINNSSGLYQMFGFLIDIIIIHRNENETCNYFTYIEEIPYQYALENILNNNDESIILYLNYGKNYGGKMNYIGNLENSTYVFGIDRGEQDHIHANKSNFIHPILKYYNLDKLLKTMHILEEPYANWTNKYSHIDPLKEFLNSIINV